MDIAKIGEFGLIDRLTEGIKPQNTSTLKGVGDDCAVMHYPDSEVLVTTDMLMEGVHFDLTYIDLQHLGYKSAMVNISDIFAMNGIPDIVYRSGAQDTDLVCVSGDLGAAYMGLQLLEREKTVYYQQIDELNQKIKAAKADGSYEQKKEMFQKQWALTKDFQPDFSGKEYLLQRQLKPEARGDIIQQLREANIRPTAMMDISDGLSSELLHICKQSGTGCRIYEKNIPIDYQTAVMAEELNMNVTTCAMNGGEDYELLFTVPIGDHEKIEAMEDVKLIGHITRKELGTMLVSRDGQEFAITAQGWNPLKD